MLTIDVFRERLVNSSAGVSIKLLLHRVGAAVTVIPFVFVFVFVFVCAFVVFHCLFSSLGEILFVVDWICIF